MAARSRSTLNRLSSFWPARPPTAATAAVPAARARNRRRSGVRADKAPAPCFGKRCRSGPVQNRRSRPGERRRPGPLAAAPGADQQRQRHRGHRDAHERRNEVRRAGIRPGDRRGDAQHAENPQPGEPVADPSQRQHPHHGRERGEHQQDPGHQDLLVVAADMTDHEILDRDRGQVDGHLTHRHHGAAQRAGEPRDQLGDAQRGGGGEQPGRRASQCASRRGSAQLCPDHALYSRPAGLRIGLDSDSAGAPAHQSDPRVAPNRGHERT